MTAPDLHEQDKDVPTCCCGGSTLHHKLGSPHCFREWVNDEIIRKIHDKDEYVLNGETLTETSLKDQRGYYLHKNGKWSRPKDRSSENSITG